VPDVFEITPFPRPFDRQDALMTDGDLHYRLGQVIEPTSTSEKRGKGGRLKRFTRCRMRWDDGQEPEFFELTEAYGAGDRTAVIYRGENYICDVNLSTGRQSQIGDRLEGIAAFLLVISIPLSFILIGIPIYVAVTVYSKVTSSRLRKRVAEYVNACMPRMQSGLPEAA
jgi:hypothetical protein